MNSDQKNFQILSLSGGGVRGLYTITILAELEQYLADEHNDRDYWIGRHFDLIAGTSIGGILALALASGVTARELKDVIDSSRKSIFPQEGRFKKIYKKLFSGSYSPTPLKEVIESVVGNKKIADLKTRVLVPAINASSGLVQTFKTSHHEDFRRDLKLKISDVALATSAAPTYFPPHQIGNSKFVDGGIAANSPALMAYYEARYFLNVEASQIRLLSVGTMGQLQTLPEKKKQKNGYLTAWGLGEKLVSMCLSSTESLHNQIVQHLLEPNQFIVVDDYLTPSQSDTKIDLDNASDEAAAILKGRAEHKAQRVINEPVVKEIFSNQTCKPKFYNLTTSSPEENK